MKFLSKKNGISPPKNNATEYVIDILAGLIKFKFLRNGTAIQNNEILITNLIGIVLNFPSNKRISPVTVKKIIMGNLAKIPKKRIEKFHHKFYF